MSDAQRARCQALLDVPADITPDRSHFTTHPAPIETRRQAVARAIEQLVRR